MCIDVLDPLLVLFSSIYFSFFFLCGEFPGEILFEQSQLSFDILVFIKPSKHLIGTRTWRGGKIPVTT